MASRGTPRNLKHGGRWVCAAARGDSEPLVVSDPPISTSQKKSQTPVVVDEVSTGGDPTRRWRQSKSGGFESFEVPRMNGNESDRNNESASRTTSSSKWDPRFSPKLRRVFLPAGYPSSVSPDYAPFIRWHLGSLVFRNVLEVLTAQSLLVALGMGSTPGALPLTAATKWVLKDGVGSFATLAAGSLGGQKYDEDPKRFWALSNLLEDVARAIELVTPAAPGLFLPLAASATFVRAAALTGRGSLMNGTFMQHLGRNENLGDVRAKLEVQGRWLALVALPVGIGIFRTVSSVFDAESGDGLYQYLGTLGAYSLVIGGHTFCCWKAAQVLRFDTLNRARLVRLAERFVGDNTVPTVDASGKEEGVYRARFSKEAPAIGAALTEIARDWKGLAEILELQETVQLAGECEPSSSQNNRRYVLGWDSGKNIPAAALNSDAEPANVIAATLAATFAAKQIVNSGLTQETLDPTIARQAYQYADQRCAEFKQQMVNAGWRVDFVQMGTAPRYNFEGLK